MTGGAVDEDPGRGSTPAIRKISAFVFKWEGYNRPLSEPRAILVDRLTPRQGVFVGCGSKNPGPGPLALLKVNPRYPGLLTFQRRSV